MDRRPRGYVGKNHETLGSDISAILDVARMPDSVLGAELAAGLKQVRPSEWYPIALMLEPLELLSRWLGEAGLPAVGIKLFNATHAASVRQNAKTAADIIYGVDAMYHHANRGKDIGGWKVIDFRPGEASIEKTTPHLCRMEEGLLRQALITVGVPATIEQTECFRKGADACLFRVSSFVTGDKWGSAR